MQDTKIPSAPQMQTIVVSPRLAVADALGWKPEFDGWYNPEGHLVSDTLVPEYFLDANTRKEMFNAMSENEKIAMCKILIHGQLQWNCYFAIMDLDQPTFCKLWLQVKNVKYGKLHRPWV